MTSSAKAATILIDSGLPASFCVLPWTHMMVKHTGQIKPCCLWRGSETDGFSQPQQGDLDIDESINSDDYRKLRKRFLAGDRPDACARCWQAEAAGIDSLRTSRVAMYQSQDLARLVSDTADGSISDFKMHWFDFRLSNICNLKCRMCFPTESSRIAQEWQELGWDLPPMASAERMQAWYEILASRIDDARLIYFAGGEPLMMETHWKILDRLIACGNTGLSLTYSTNLTHTIWKGRSIYDIWQRFNDIHLSLSIDHVGIKAGYVRHGTDWDMWLSNWEQLRRRCPHVKWRVATTVTALNVMDLPDIISELLARGILHAGNELELFPAESPEYLDIRGLPSTIKHDITRDLTAWCQKPPSGLPADAVPGMRAIIEWMNTMDIHNDIRADFRNVMMQQDAARGEDIGKLFPRLHDIYIGASNVL